MKEPRLTIYTTSIAAVNRSASADLRNMLHLLRHCLAKGKLVRVIDIAAGPSALAAMCQAGVPHSRLPALVLDYGALGLAHFNLHDLQSICDDGGALL